MSHGIIARTQPRWPTSKPNAMHHVAVMPAIQVPSLLVLAQGLNLIDSSLSLGFSLHLSPLMSLFFVPSWLCQARYKLGSFKALSVYLNSQSRTTLAMCLFKESGEVLTTHSSSCVA